MRIENMTYHHGFFDEKSKMFVQTAMRFESEFFSAFRENLTDIIGVRVSSFHNASMFNNESVAVKFLIVMNESSVINADTSNQIKNLLRYFRDERNLTFRIDASFNITVRGKCKHFLKIDYVKLISICTY